MLADDAYSSLDLDSSENTHLDLRPTLLGCYKKGSPHRHQSRQSSEPNPDDFELPQFIFR